MRNNKLRYLPSIKETMVPVTYTHVWYEKGYHWHKEITFEPDFWGDKDLGILVTWKTPPKVKIRKGYAKSLMQDDYCRCEDCLKGRKEVKAGWRPKC